MGGKESNKCCFYKFYIRKNIREHISELSELSENSFSIFKLCLLTFEGQAASFAAINNEFENKSKTFRSVAIE